MTSREGYDAYTLYLGIKLHFINKEYNFIKYNGKVKADIKSFLKRKDKYHFGKYGILVPLGDERELVYAINQMQIEDVRVNYSSKSKLRAEDFCIGKISAEYWQFLRRFL